MPFHRPEASVPGKSVDRWQFGAIRIFRTRMDAKQPRFRPGRARKRTGIGIMKPGFKTGHDIHNDAGPDGQPVYN